MSGRAPRLLLAVLLTLGGCAGWPPCPAPSDPFDPARPGVRDREAGPGLGLAALLVAGALTLSRGPCGR